MLDRFIKAFPFEEDGDLSLCIRDGVAYQMDRQHVCSYGKEYFDKCLGYEDKDIATKINEGRIALVARHFGGRVCDIGIGSGEFVKKRPNTYGNDVNPTAVEWLRRQGRLADSLVYYGALTFWDVIEHVPDPGVYLDRIQLHSYAFFSIPVFDDLTKIRESKHYRPGEHLYYWTQEGFQDWMYQHGFLCKEVSDFETQAGRESILSFAFRRFAWRR